MNLPSLYLITDAERVGDSHMVDVVAAASRAGLCMVQVREKNKSLHELRAFVDRLRDSVVGPMLWVLNYPAGLAADLGVDGVHVGGGVVEHVGEAREQLGDDKILGYSAHDITEIPRAFDLGATYVSYSPVLPTRSKMCHGPVLGFESFEDASRPNSGPVYALGGVGAESASVLRACGAAGLGVIGSIVDAADPEVATREILESWNDG